MISLGIPPQKPNPYVNYGTPKAGQLWKQKNFRERFVVVHGFDSYSNVVKYKWTDPHCIGLGKTLCTAELGAFLESFYFSH